jgi:hypothetical protein
MSGGNRGVKRGADFDSAYDADDEKAKEPRFGLDMAELILSYINEEKKNDDAMVPRLESDEMADLFAFYQRRVEESGVVEAMEPRLGFDEMAELHKSDIFHIRVDGAFVRHDVEKSLADAPADAPRNEDWSNVLVGEIPKDGVSLAELYTLFLNS